MKIGLYVEERGGGGGGGRGHARCPRQACQRLVVSERIVGAGCNKRIRRCRLR